jgi:hypothetical protein
MACVTRRHHETEKIGWYGCHGIPRFRYPRSNTDGKKAASATRGAK